MVGWGQFPKLIFLRNLTKDQDLDRKLMFTKSYPSWGWGEMELNFKKIIFLLTEDYMKYPDLHSKVMFTDPNPSWGRREWVNFHIFWGQELSEISRYEQKTHVWQYPNRKGLWTVY